MLQSKLNHLKNKVDQVRLRVEKNLKKMKKMLEEGSSFIERMSILDIKSYLDLIKYLG